MKRKASVQENEKTHGYKLNTTTHFQVYCRCHRQIFQHYC